MGVVSGPTSGHLMEVSTLCAGLVTRLRKPPSQAANGQGLETLPLFGMWSVWCIYIP